MCRNNQEFHTFLEIKYGIMSVVREHTKRLEKFFPGALIHVFESEMNGDLIIRIEFHAGGKNWGFDERFDPRYLERRPGEFDRHLCSSIGGMVMRVYEQI